jgi:DNA invertase Pin-like site-specific DNA recombinase
MMKVYGYVRVSGKGQVDGEGPDRQRDAIEIFCKAQGLEWGGHFFEEGVSGTVEAIERPKFAEMIEYITKNDFAGFVVERMDRLARDLMVSEVLLQECRKQGIQVFSVDQGTLEDMASNGGDPTRVLIRQIMGALAQWDKSVTVKKLKSARDAVRQKTGRCEGVKPYGSRGSEVAILGLLKNMLDCEKPLDYGAVARMLNENGFKTRGGKDWSRVSVRTVWLTYKKKGK